MYYSYTKYKYCHNIEILYKLKIPKKGNNLNDFFL